MRERRNNRDRGKSGVQSRPHCKGLTSGGANADCASTTALTVQQASTPGIVVSGVKSCGQPGSAKLRSSGLTFGVAFTTNVVEVPMLMSVA
jgi:hypothetical protein